MVALFVDRDVDLLAERLQLVDGGGAVDVGGDQQRIAALLAQVHGELAGVGRLAGALQADQHQDRAAAGRATVSSGRRRRPAA